VLAACGAAVDADRLPAVAATGSDSDGEGTREEDQYGFTGFSAAGAEVRFVCRYINQQSHLRGPAIGTSIALKLSL
jgi:hypothetical protein